MTWEARLRVLAERQHGLVCIDQIASMEVTHDHWYRAARNGRWDRLSLRVLRLVGCDATPTQRALAGVMDAGGQAFLHGRSTLSLVGLACRPPSVVQVARRRPSASRQPSLAHVHRLRELDPLDCTQIHGVPTVRPLRAMWSEASRFRSEEAFEVGVHVVGALLDDANRKGLVTWADLEESVERLGRRGRAGTRVMRACADLRRPGSAPTESRLEERVESMARSCSIPLERQVHVGGQSIIGRVDHRHPTLPLVVETNSLTYHALPSDRLADGTRYAALQSAGFTVVVVWEPDVWLGHSMVEPALRLGVAAARSGTPSIIHTPSCPWPPDETRIVARPHDLGPRG